MLHVNMSLQEQQAVKTVPSFTTINANISGSLSQNNISYYVLLPFSKFSIPCHSVRMNEGIPWESDPL